MSALKPMRIAHLPAILTALTVFSFSNGVGAETGTRASTTGQPTFHQSTPMKIKINIDGTPLTATLLDSPATRDFIAMLPLDLVLKDYAKTEKISDLPGKLTTVGSPDGVKPAAGDITFYAPWGNLAIFYRDFSYSQGLVKLGTMDSGAELLRRPDPIKARIELVAP
jgi:hypothetical protein